MAGIFLVGLGVREVGDEPVPEMHFLEYLFLCQDSLVINNTHTHTTFERVPCTFIYSFGLNLS